MKKISAQNDAGYAAPIGLAADAVVFTAKDGELAVLLVRRQEAPQQGSLALPGGFVGENEDPGDTVARKLEEKTGVVLSAGATGPGYFEELQSYASPDRDPRGWLPSIAYLALVPASALPEQHQSDADWYAVNTTESLAFDHAQIIADGIERLRGKLWYSNIARALLAPEFTIQQAREVYELITGREYAAGNFSRDLRRTGLIEACGDVLSPARGRPAGLYRFVSQDFSWLRRSR